MVTTTALTLLKIQRTDSDLDSKTDDFRRELPNSSEMNALYIGLQSASANIDEHRSSILFLGTLYTLRPA